LQRNAEDHLLLVRDEDMAWRMARGIHGDQREAAAKEWMGGISDDDLLRQVIVWVLEWGIKVFGRSIGSITPICWPSLTRFPD
jgi:hypothetical protein